MKLFIKVIFFTFMSIRLFAQGVDTTKFPFNKMKINFAVPDMPAFKAMGVEASNLLRPSSAQALSIIAPQFWNTTTNSVTLPKNFALEISPVLLSQSNKKVPITLNNFLQNKVINSFRISIGTAQDSTEKQPKASKLSIGFRITLRDDGDFNTDPSFLRKEGVIMADSAAYVLELRTKWLQETSKKLGKSVREILADSLLKKKLDNYQDSVISTINPIKKIRSNQEFYIKKIQDLREKYKREKWNATKLDLALAFVGRSEDQFASNLKFNKFSSWLTLASKCKDWGQWLNGVNYSYATNVFSEKEKKNIDFPQFSYSSRLFIGSNELKGFVEGQYMYNGFDKSNNGFLNIGGEYALGNSGIWLHCYAGYQHGDTIKQVIGNLDFRFSLPEK